METISELSQLDFFAILGLMILLIAIGLVLPTFIVKDHRKKLSKNPWVMNETLARKDSMVSSEKE